jgi:hypothetical protein
LGERADLIERRGEGDQAVAGNAAVGRLEADHAAVRGRLADRAAGIGAERGDGGAIGHGGGGATGGTAGDAVRVACGLRVVCRAEFSVAEPIANSSMIHAAEGDGTGGAELADDGGVVGRGVVFREELRAAGAGLAEDVDVVLDGDRDAAEGQ